MSERTRRYARMLMDLAKQEGREELFRSELEKISDLLTRNSELSSFLTSSDNSVSDKKATLQRYFGNTLDKGVLDACFSIGALRERNYNEVMLINDFLTYYYQLQGKHHGVIYSARRLDDSQIAAIEDAVSRQVDQKVKLENRIDDSLIGGIKVVVGNNVWDGSYRSRIREMKEELLTWEDDSEASARDINEDIRRQLEAYDRENITVKSADTTGYVTSVADGIVTIRGVNKAMSGELLRIGESSAMVMNLEEESVGAVLLDDSTEVREGMEVISTGRVVETPVGDELLGRVVDAVGRPLDGRGAIKASRYMPIERPAPGVIDRQSVNEPLQTGIKIIDAMVPIGKGQRELIIGDRQTGKTAIAIDTILNQQGKDVKCIYVAIGQKNSTVAQIVEKLKQNGAMNYTTVVVAGASEMASLQYVAPYTGCTIGEYWMNRGEDVLIVYDDLSKHAVAYRTLSLLLRRPPGREAYPGDVFYLHSRLLERSAKLSDRNGGGSLTALPIVETLAGDISAYIPTNVISITDGQIFLQTELFNSGVRPAVDSGLSVSRVGSAAQSKAMKKVASSLKLDLAQYQEVLDFAQFGSDLDQSTRRTINHGQHLTELLKQPQYSPFAQEDQIVVLFANQRGYIDTIPLNRVRDYEKSLLMEIHSSHPELVSQLATGEKMSDELTEELNRFISDFTTRYKTAVK
ncbi:MAG: F0F1 ATP synthase subunit alpha [Erysipelotrichaceae bacterium]|nr:F0F1 ATP synthase subunit alpha [Erysipelotrichaceae bacterium]